MSRPAASSGSRKIDAYRAIGELVRRVHAEAEAERERQRALPPPASAEEALTRALRVAGPFGLTLADCREILGCFTHSRRDEAIAVVRAASWVAETQERRPSAGGADRKQIVLRLAEAAEAYSGDLGTLSGGFFATPPVLQKTAPATASALGELSEETRAELMREETRSGLNVMIREEREKHPRLSDARIGCRVLDRLISPQGWDERARPVLELLMHDAVAAERSRTGPA